MNPAAKCPECPYVAWGTAGDEATRVEHLTRTHHIVYNATGDKWDSLSVLPASAR